MTEPLTAGTSAGTLTRQVKVWDFPTRLFHWGLLGLILVCWFTGEEEGPVGQIHRFAGEAIAGLLVFRLVWGFCGGEHARFSDFAAGPAAIARHLKGLFSGVPERHLGHNPLGGVFVFLLLLNVTVIVIAGLFSSGEGRSGPFVGLWGLELSELHEIAFRVLQGLVLIHILGVIVETMRTRDALLPAMITGSKRRRDNESGEDAKTAGVVSLLVSSAFAIAAAAILMGLPQSSQLAGEHETSEHSDHGERDD